MVRDVEIELQVVDWTVRTFTTKEGESERSGAGRSESTGRCRLTSWAKVDLQPGSFIRIQNARVQAWQGLQIW